MTNIHHAAAQGYIARAATYATGRPDYPPGLIDWLRGTIGLAPCRRAIDLGAGTGKAIPSLAATGAQIVAIEPVASMRSELAARFPDIEVLEGTAEAMPLPDASADALICAQSFHWFSTPRALAEIHRVLRPDGRLGLVWNVRDESVPWVAALTRILAPYEGDTPRHRSGRWKALFPAEGFGPLTERRIAAHPHVGPAERVIVDRTLSVSFVAALPADAQAEVARQVRALIAATPELADRDEVAFPYLTEAWSCDRL